MTGAAAEQHRSVVVAERLSKRFFNIQALEDVSFDLRAGEVHAVVGENGAGKSTLIKLLVGIHHPDSGRILLDGHERRFRDPHEALAAGLAVIPQEPRLVPALSVAENVLLGHLPGRRLLGVLPLVDRRALRTQAREALDRLGLPATLDTRVGTLPYAEQQLVAIARGLMSRPKLLMIDEPFLGLSPTAVRQILSVVQAINKEGVALLFTEQNVELALSVSRRAYVLESGRVALTGRADEVLGHEMVRRVYLGI